MDNGIAWSFTPSCPPDHSKIHHVLEPSIDAEHIILHLRLLRLFKEFKQNVKEWAASEEVNTDRLWVFTMNLATKRMFRWFSASFEYQLQEITPPIDVLLIWYCFLLRPAEWQQYVTETNLTLKCWSWPMLKHAVLQSRNQVLELPPESARMASVIFRDVDIIETLSSCRPLFKLPQGASNPDWDTPACRFETEVSCHKLAFSHSTNTSFHEDVAERMQFADMILKYSWDRVYPMMGASRRHFIPAIERYAKYMTLLSKFHQRTSHVLPGTRDPFDTLTATPDVELVWRTHTLSHGDYGSFREDLGLGLPGFHFNSSGSRSGESLGFTDSFYRDTYGEAYVLCLCWYCMASRDDSLRRDFSAKLVPVVLQLEDKIDADSGRPNQLTLAQRQCRHCGLHPKRPCSRKDLMGSRLKSPCEVQRIERVLGFLRGSTHDIWQQAHDMYRHSKARFLDLIIHGGRGEDPTRAGTAASSTTDDDLPPLDWWSRSAKEMNDSSTGSASSGEMAQCIRPSLTRTPLG